VSANARLSRIFRNRKCIFRYLIDSFKISQIAFACISNAFNQNSAAAFEIIHRGIHIILRSRFFPRRRCRKSKSMDSECGFLSNKSALFFPRRYHISVRAAHGRGVATSPISAAAASRGRLRRYEPSVDRARSVTFGSARPSSRAVTVRNVSYSSTLARKSLCVFSGRGYSPGPYHGVSNISFKSVTPPPSYFLYPSPTPAIRGRDPCVRYRDLVGAVRSRRGKPASISTGARAKR